MTPAVLPLVPRDSVVRQIVNNEWLRDLCPMDAKERRKLAAEVGRQNDYLRATGERL
jgi:hypothetical protein